jgi:hypothetical protein
MNKDLFECPNKLPSKIQVILRRFNDLEIKRGIQCRPRQNGQGNG